MINTIVSKKKIILQLVELGLESFCFIGSSIVLKNCSEEVLGLNLV